MTPLLTPNQLAALAKIDSPTIANAIEAFNVRDATEGYASLELRCLFPDLPPFVGYAITCTADSTTPGDRKNKPNVLRQLYEALAAAPKPSVVVIKDVGPQRLRSCHAGDVMGSIFHRLGACAVITDGGLRDLAGVRQRAPGLHMFAPGVVVSHGVPVIVEVNVTVNIFGLTVRPGDLLHGDANGVVSIPHAVADRVAAEAEQVWAREADVVGAVQAADFSLQTLGKKLGWH